MKNDLISRKDAIDAMLKLQAEDVEMYGCRIPEGFDGDRAKEALEQLPAAQSESKTGKWIEAYDPFNRISGRCSVCGWEAHLYEDDVVGMNYCPNCGAEMEKLDD